MVPRSIGAASIVAIAGTLFGVARFNANGTLDTSFDSDGRQTFAFPSAFNMGADAVIVAGGPTPGVDLFNPNAIRASAGTIFYVPVAAASTADVIAWLRERGVAILAARVEGSELYTDVDLRGGFALVLGSEAEGLTDAGTRPDVTSIRLPMQGIADSLNVSVAAAVLLYEARRQRGVGPSAPRA